MNRTKIVCTLGPACDDDDKIRAMLRAGMNVARINFSHGDHAAQLARIERVRRIAKELKIIIAILGDLQGPKLRVGEIANGFVMTYADREIILTTREVPGDEHEVHLPHPDLVHDVKPGQHLLLDDGQLEFVVVSTTETDMRCKVVNGGPLSSHKGVSAPGANLSLSALSDKDRDDAVFGAEQQLDYLALSFVRTAEDVKGFASFPCTTLNQYLYPNGWLITGMIKMGAYDFIEKPLSLDRVVRGVGGGELVEDVHDNGTGHLVVAVGHVVVEGFLLVGRAGRNLPAVKQDHRFVGFGKRLGDPHRHRYRFRLAGGAAGLRQKPPGHRLPAPPCHCGRCHRPCYHCSFLSRPNSPRSPLLACFHRHRYADSLSPAQERRAKLLAIPLLWRYPQLDRTL